MSQDTAYAQGLHLNKGTIQDRFYKEDVGHFVAFEGLCDESGPGYLGRTETISIQEPACGGIRFFHSKLLSFPVFSLGIPFLRIPRHLFLHHILYGFKKKSKKGSRMPIGFELDQSFLGSETKGDKILDIFLRLSYRCLRTTRRYCGTRSHHTGSTQPTNNFCFFCDRILSWADRQ